MQNVLVSALEQENRTLIDRVIKLEAKIQQNETLYLKSQTSAALISHDKALEDQTKIRALQDSLHQLEVDLARVTTEYVGQQTKCASVEKALQLSEKAKNNLISETAKVKRVVAQYQANEELLVKALENYINMFSNTGHDHASEGRLIPTLPSYIDEGIECPCLDRLNRTLYAIVLSLNANRSIPEEARQSNHEKQALHIENERLRAEIITLRVQLEAEKAERKVLLEDAKESFSQLKSLQVAQLEIRTNKIHELEGKVTLLESALKRKQEQLDELTLQSRVAYPAYQQMERVTEVQKEEVQVDQRSSFVDFAEPTLNELALDISREKAASIGDSARGLRRVSFNSRVLYSSPTSPAFSSVSKVHSKAPTLKNEIDNSIMSMATGRRLSVIEAADTVRTLTE
ncbi:Hypothetical protein GLP15_661 [Giardia lamblia P15]|uniref:Uncharacterized protein n=1 Tax=Giardia intestinalis (strain P15) TaxID=658858 RepID=E1F5C4_GIAIA|nr:Hypothetical protein GLP15_661 [Giardia lamblia P15]